MKIILAMLTLAFATQTSAGRGVVRAIISTGEMHRYEPSAEPAYRQ